MTESLLADFWAERDELIRLIWDDDTTYDDAATLADAILAAGWRRR